VGGSRGGGRPSILMSGMLWSWLDRRVCRAPGTPDHVTMSASAREAILLDEQDPEALRYISRPRPAPGCRQLAIGRQIQIALDAVVQLASATHPTRNGDPGSQDKR